MYTTTMDTPSILPRVDRVIVIGDVHGDLSRLMDILYACKIINQNLQWIAEPQNTVVVQLGDQIDSKNRMPTNPNETWEKLHDIEVMKFMDQLDVLARRHGGRVISMIGNHELMNVLGDFSYVSPKSLEKSNGRDARQRLFSVGGEMAQRLSRRNILQKVGSLLFVHGGLLPMHLDVLHDNIHIVNEGFRKYLRNQHSEITEAEMQVLSALVFNDEGVLWTRKYMEMQNNPVEMKQILENVLQRTECTKIFVGHNTVSNIGTFGGQLWFTDSGLSRAYGNTQFEALDIGDDGANINIIRITKTGDM
jgi:hypothetical protein